MIFEVIGGMKTNEVKLIFKDYLPDAVFSNIQFSVCAEEGNN